MPRDHYLTNAFKPAPKASTAEHIVRVAFGFAIGACCALSALGFAVWASLIASGGL